MTDSEPQTISLFVQHARPKSKGSVTLDVEKYRAGIRDDRQLALVDFRLLTHPDDIDVMLEGIKLALLIAEDTSPFKKLNMTYGAGHHTKCMADDFRSDDYWRCVIQEESVTWNHSVRTCSLGPVEGDSNTSVLDSKFRVRGVTGLRVLDGSVTPQVPNSNTNAPILMLAEKAADDVLTFWSKKIN